MYGAIALEKRVSGIRNSIETSNGGIVAFSSSGSNSGLASAWIISPERRAMAKFLTRRELVFGVAVVAAVTVGGRTCRRQMAGRLPRRGRGLLNETANAQTIRLTGAAEVAALAASRASTFKTTNGAFSIIR